MIIFLDYCKNSNVFTCPKGFKRGKPAIKQQPPNFVSRKNIRNGERGSYFASKLRKGITPTNTAVYWVTSVVVVPVLGMTCIPNPILLNGLYIPRGESTFAKKKERETTKQVADIHIMRLVLSLIDYLLRLFHVLMALKSVYLARRNP
ncbi:hypothetical protein WA026_006577 [Henosepilachna vigintioctopunctata]|uniref:Uncharacterized protein n=1 Tax=Henosepilachna vigintioctopunctata TaxID=420089 RepID=A0AAW1UED6_9CUCU